MLKKDLFPMQLTSSKKIFCCSVCLFKKPSKVLKQSICVFKTSNEIIYTSFWIQKLIYSFNKLFILNFLLTIWS